MKHDASNAVPWPSDALGQPDLTTAAAAREMSRRLNRRVAPSTIWRWAAFGRAGIHLPHLRWGRTIRTSHRALDWFGAALAAAELRASRQPPRRAEIAANLSRLVEREQL